MFGQKDEMLTRDEVADLYRRTGGLVLQRCRLLLGDAAEAEDVLHEVFIRVMRYGGTVKEKQVPLSWLYRTAERCCFDRMRKSKREPVADPEMAKMLCVVDENACHEAAELAIHFFHQLNPQLKQIALLRYIDDLTQERIAEETGWSRRTVGKKLKMLKRKAEQLARNERGE